MLIILNRARTAVQKFMTFSHVIKVNKKYNQFLRES
jgi:hypothetical protein